MKDWRLPAALLIATVLGSGPVAGSPPAIVVDAFRLGCLDHLPDFSGSPAALRRLGFSLSGETFRLETSEGEILAHVTAPGADSVGACIVNAELPLDARITPAVAAAIAEITDNRFRHKGVEVEGVRAETFVWSVDDLRVSVALVPDVMGMQSLSVLAGRVAE